MKNKQQLDLKPCPFCGSEAVSKKFEGNWDSDSYEPESIVISCSNLNCLVDPEITVYAEMVMYNYYLDEEEAVTLWNTRIPEQKQSKTIDKLVEALEWVVDEDIDLDCSQDVVYNKLLEFEKLLTTLKTGGV